LPGKFRENEERPYNVGLSEANLSKQELCEEIKKQVPDFYFIEAAIGEDTDKRNYIVSNDKIEATGFQPQVSLQQGIRELIKGYQVIRRNQYGNNLGTRQFHDNQSYTFQDFFFRWRH
jgi:nucleoside-diphosphate-sugar epimerase